MKNRYLLSIVLFLFVISVKVQILIDDERSKEGLSLRYLFSPGDMINSILAGGFRGIAADLLWLQIDDYSHLGQWYKLLPIFRIITFLQPKFITAWSVGGWHMSFNLYHHANTESEKKKWLSEGIQFLKRGILNNPDRYELYFELGWVFFQKANDFKNSIRYLRRAVHFEHPQFVDHLLAHAYEKNGQIQEALEIWKNIQKRPESDKAMERVVSKAIMKNEEILRNQDKSP